MTMKRRDLVAAAAGSAVLLLPGSGNAATAAEIDRDVDEALHRLITSNEGAKALSEKAVGILVFPQIIKGGILVGGAYGEGALRRGGKTVGYYNSAAASYGLQLGVQTYGYALFFMTEDALGYLDRSGGWEVGVGPSVVVLDEGTARRVSSTTVLEEVYAFVFAQQGLMAGAGVEGSKITRFNP
jgi:lipid-binding SYLF domain-containing protein